MTAEEEGSHVMCRRAVRPDNESLIPLYPTSDNGQRRP